jgi:hypothetical protein
MPPSVNEVLVFAQDAGIDVMYELAVLGQLPESGEGSLRTHQYRDACQSNVNDEFNKLTLEEIAVL